MNTSDSSEALLCCSGAQRTQVCRPPEGKSDAGGHHHRDFGPPFCPNPCCSLHHRGAEDQQQWWSDHGSYHTRIRGRVPRYRCRRCRRCFSSQTFSTGYYLKVELPLPLMYHTLVGGMSLRAISRTLGCSMGSVLNRLARLSRQAITMHRALLRDIELSEDLCADGFVDFTVSQYFPDVTTIVVGSASQMIYAIDHCYLRRRGRMSQAQRQRRSRLEQRFRAPAEGERNSLTEALIETLSLSWNRSTQVCLDTDENRAYRRALGDVARVIPQVCDPRLFSHRTTSSRAARTASNPLFAVNYIDRQIRLNLAAHRRQTVCFGRDTSATLQRTVLLLCYHNYAKAQRIVDTAVQPPVHAVVAGVSQAQIQRWWRWFFVYRSFFTKANPSGFLRSLWLQCAETPLSDAAEYIPKYAVA